MIDPVQLTANNGRNLKAEIDNVGKKYADARTASGSID